MKNLSFNFNLYVLNFIIGLQKGSLLLKPHSIAFKKLGFEVFAFERKFEASASGSIQPEIILTSKKISNSLLFESALATIEQKLDKKKSKENQPTRYKDAEIDNLRDIALIPKDALNSFDIPHIVNDKNLQGFIDFLTKNPEYKFPLLVFNFNEQDKIYSVKHIQNPFTNADVEKFFSQEIQFTRNPSYIPFELNKTKQNVETILEKAVLILIKILNKNKLGSTFTTEQVAAEIFNGGMWDCIENNTKVDVLQILNKFIDEILSTYINFKTNYFNRKSKTEFEIFISDVNRNFIMNKMNKKIYDFAQSKIHPHYGIQTTLEFE